MGGCPNDSLRSMVDKDPELTKFALIILALPATQVTDERAFSALPLVLTSRRQNFSADKATELMLTKIKKMFYFPCSTLAICCLINGAAIIPSVVGTKSISHI